MAETLLYIPMNLCNVYNIIYDTYVYNPQFMFYLKIHVDNEHTGHLYLFNRNGSMKAWSFRILKALQEY